MKVRYKESGGFAGIVRGCELSSSELSGEEISELQKLVDECDVSAVSPCINKEARDSILIETTIENESGKHTFVFDDTSVPDSFKPLFKYLRKQSKPMKLD